MRSGIVELLDRHGVDLRDADGKRVHIVVVGRGVSVGPSIGLLLTRRAINATVTLTHTPAWPPSSWSLRACLSSSPPTWSSPVRIAIDVGVSRVTDPVTGKSKVADEMR